MMEYNEFYTALQVARLNRRLLAEALNALHNLVGALDDDLFTDAPECQSSINRAEDALQDAYKVLVQIQAELGQDHGGWLTDPPDCRAQRILCEAEEAFEVVSMAHERASCGNWPAPALVQDCLFWIEDEARVQENLLRCDQAAVEDWIYTRALWSLASELRGLGFQPALAPWQRINQIDEWEQGRPAS
jgi:hypothetical protein